MKFTWSYHFIIQRMTNIFYSQISGTVRFILVTYFITHMYLVMSVMFTQTSVSKSKLPCIPWWSLQVISHHLEETQWYIFESHSGLKVRNFNLKSDALPEEGMTESRLFYSKLKILHNMYSGAGKSSPKLVVLLVNTRFGECGE